MDKKYDIKQFKKDVNKLFIAFSFIVMGMLILSIIYSFVLSGTISMNIASNPDKYQGLNLSGKADTFEILKAVYNEKIADIIMQFSQVVVYLIAFSVAFAVYYFIAIRGKEKTKDFCFIKKPSKKGWIKDIFMGYAVVVGFSYIQALIMAVLNHFGINIDELPIVTPVSIFGGLLLLIGICILPMFFEELIFRGIPMGGMKKYGSFAVIAISSISFSLMHARLIQIPYAFVAGIILAMLCIKYDSIVVGMVFHILNNGISYMLLILKESKSPVPIFIGSSIALIIISVGAAFLIDKCMFKKNILKDFDKDFNMKKEVNLSKSQIVKGIVTSGGFYGFLACCAVAMIANILVA